MSRRVITSVLILVLGCLSAAAFAESSPVISSAFFADTPFPQFMHLWQEGWNLKGADGQKLIYARPGMPLGGYAFIYYRNMGRKPVKVTDLMLEGVRLSRALGVTETPPRAEDRYGSSILLSKLDKQTIAKVVKAGTPVWWKPEPDTIPAGGVGEIILRLRRAPGVEKLSIGIITDKSTISTTIPVNQSKPRFSTISFNPDLNTVYLYSRYPEKPGARPVKILLDERDVTRNAVIASDKTLDFSAVVIKLPKPLEWMSYHQFRAVYPDGNSAAAGIRAWGREMVYGMWGYSDSGSSENAARQFLDDWASHNINMSMGMVAGSGRDYFDSDAGWKYCESLGIDRMTTWTVENHRPAMFFLYDEPDAHDAGFKELPADQRLGAHGQFLVKWAGILRRFGPETPILLNTDNTYKPENWYMYHQLADIPCLDPYYPEQLDQSYRNHPGQFAAHTRPTYVYATSAISQSAGQPKPLHVLLCSTQYYDDKYTGRFPTPEEKRMELYYALAAGAKGISYWWYTPRNPCNGCRDDSPAAKALWKEIGLLGAEVRTAGPVITRSSPADLKLRGPAALWLRSLVSGTDTACIITVNDDVLCDRLGTVVKPVEKAVVTARVPSWLIPKDAFEITCEGIRQISWKLKGSEVTLDLGTVNVSRFVIVTADSTLGQTLQKRYEAQFSERVKALLSEGNGHSN